MPKVKIGVIRYGTNYSKASVKKEKQASYGADKARYNRQTNG